MSSAAIFVWRFKGLIDQAFRPRQLQCSLALVNANKHTTSKCFTIFHQYIAKTAHRQIGLHNLEII